MDTYAWTATGMRPSKDAPTLFVKAHEVVAKLEQAVEQQPPPMTLTLEDKLAAMVWYLDEINNNRRDKDKVAFKSYLNDPEIMDWLDKMNKAGRLRNTRFTLR